MKTTIIVIVAIVFLITLKGTLFIVQEPEQAIITQFGKPVRGISNPGLHAKIPFVQKAIRFDKRFLEWDGDANQLPTKDKRFIWVDTYARWRISDPLLFFQRLRDERGAQSRLDDIIDGETRNSIAKHYLVELIRSSNRETQGESLSPQDKALLQNIKYGRNKIRKEVLANSQKRTKDLGIEILDVQFKRINYVEEVRKKVYERMIAERRRIADRFRSEGEGEASRIRGEKDRELKRIQSEAYRKAREIKGRAEAEATRIYAAAYNRSADARAFYEFIKTMETYEQAFDEKTTLILTTKGEFYKFLK